MDESQVEKPIPKLHFWFFIFVIVAKGIFWIVIGVHLYHGIPILLGIITVVALFPLRSLYQKRCRDYEAYRREQEAYLREQLQKIEDYLRQQQRLYEDIRRIERAALERIQKMHENLNAATEALDTADTHFKRPAYSPFWTAIEKAASELGRFSNNLAAQSSSLENYLQIVPRYHGGARSYPGSGQAFLKLRRKGEALADRMSELVNKAHENFKFSNIYELRRNTKTVADGFKNLDGILRGVGKQISGHIQELNTTVEVYGDLMVDLKERAAAQYRERDDEAWIQRELHQIENMQADLQRVEREEEALEILGDISSRTEEIVALEEEGLRIQERVSRRLPR